MKSQNITAREEGRSSLKKKKKVTVHIVVLNELRKRLKMFRLNIR